MLLTLFAGAAFIRRYRDTGRVMLGMITVYGLGLAAASAWSALDDRPVQYAYLAVFGAMAAGSALVLLLDGTAEPRRW